MATRLVWSGDRIATLVGGRGALFDAGGAPVCALPFDRPLIDLCFDRDGELVTFNDAANFQRLDRDGRLVRAWAMRDQLNQVLDGSIAPRSQRVHIQHAVHNFYGLTLWRFRPDDYDVNASRYAPKVLDPLGVRVAISHATLPGDKRPPGRGWLVIALPADGPPVTRPRGHDILDRHWLQTRAEPGSTLFAFDAAGARMIHASPEATPHVGAIRVGKDRAYTTAHPGGAHAIALDPRGIIAAYAYPDAPRRFRIDYLDPEDSDASMIDVLDSLFIDASLPDIAALAFSPDSHAIACLAKSGAIEIVPVP